MDPGNFHNPQVVKLRFYNAGVVERGDFYNSGAYAV
jgi:hypothetical protein